MRDSLQESFDVCCLWQSYEADFQKTLSVADFDKAKSCFLKGIWDKEFVEKVKTQSDEISMESFRWLQQFIGVHSTVLSVEERSVQAELELEKAKYKAMCLKLEGEQGKFQSFVRQLSDWKASHAASRRTHLLGEKAKFEEACQTMQSASLPVSVLESGFVVTQSLKSYEEFSQPRAYHVLLCDLTKLGTGWSKHINDIVTKVSACVAPNKDACCLMIAPNRARWGESDSEEKISESVHDVEATLKAESAHLICRRIQIIFSEESLQQHSTRAATHDAWMILPNTESEFSSSALWIRRAAQDCQARPTGEMTNQSVGHITLNLSKPQRMKQAMSGAALWQSIFTKLLSGMKTTIPVFITDLLLYDSSVVEAMLLRKAQSKQNFKVLSIIWATESTKDAQAVAEKRQIYKFLVPLFWRQIGKMHESKVLALDGFKKAELKQDSIMPSLNEGDFEMTCPMPSGDSFLLPFRQSFLDTVTLTRWAVGSFLITKICIYIYIYIYVPTAPVLNGLFQHACYPLHHSEETPQVG